jgi:hypothetical protein
MVVRYRIHMFLCHPDPDPLVRGMDPDPDLSSRKNCKKNLDPTVNLLLLDFLSLKNDVQGADAKLKVFGSRY